MAERLGEAVLELRTNDTAFNAGIAGAQVRAEKLGGTLEKASGSSGKLAGEMIRTGASAEQMSRGFEQAGRQVESSANAQRASMQNLGFQLNDVATMFALGASPMQIFASQGGQIIQVLQQMASASAQSGSAAGDASTDIEGMGDTVLETADKAKDMGGKLGAVAGFLSGPWGIALTVAIVALSPFISKLFEAEDALDAVEFASNGLGEAQSILGSVMDRTTLQITAQSEALVVLARAQAAAGRIGAINRRAEAEGTLRDIRKGDITLQAGFGGGLRFAREGDGTEDVVTGYQSGNFNSSFALSSLESRLKAGRISQTAYSRAATAITNFEVEGANVKVFEDLQAALNGDGAAARAIFGEQKSPRTRQRRERAGPQPRSAAEISDDFDSQSFSLERDTLQARLALATSAQDRADLQRELLSLERQQRIATIEASDLTDDMKNALIKQVEAVLGREPVFDEQGNLMVTANRGLEGEIIARELAVRQLEQSQALADVRFQGETEALQNALALADTEAARKDIALRLLSAEEEFERIRLQTIIDAAARGEAEAEAAQLAQSQLDALNANAPGRRAAVSRRNETESERYLRDLNKTPGQVNEAIDGIRIDGLEALNDGLTDAIMGAESLGDVFSRIADQIIADLLRIAIQQAIIKPLGNALFGDSGGGLGGFLGSLFGGGPDASLAGSVDGLFSGEFAGLFAKGGTIPTGQFGIVGEEGPEIAFGGAGGLGILSNPDSQRLLKGQAGGATSVSMPITIDATGADAAAIARLNSRLDQLQQDLPGRIVSTVQDASNRRIINMGGGR